MSKEKLTIESVPRENLPDQVKKKAAPVPSFEGDSFEDIPADKTKQPPPVSHTSGEENGGGISPIESQLREVEPLEAVGIPEPLRLWITDAAYRLNCPPDFIAVSAIVTAGSLIGSRLAVKPKANDPWNEVPNLWGGIIAPPSSKKTPATNEALKLLEPLEVAAEQQYDEDKTEAAVELDLLATEEKQLKSKLKTDNRDETKARLKQIAQAKKDLQPVRVRYQVNDTTQEKLADICVENPKGVLAFRDELTGLLRSWEKQGNESARAFYLEAWNGKNSYRIDRVVKGSSMIPTLCASVFGGIQPDKIKQYVTEMLSGENDGLMQRFQLLIYPDPEPYNYVDKAPNRQAKQKAAELMEALAYADEAEFERWGAKQGEDRYYIGFDPYAQLEFEQWNKRLHSKIHSGEYSSAEEQHLSKYPSLMPCLALIFHALEAAAYPSRTFEGINAPAAQKAIYWCDYLEQHARRVYALGNANAAAEKLSKQISAGKLHSGFKPREVQQKGWEHLRKAAQVKEALSELEAAGWIKAEESDPMGTGRKADPTYTIHPDAIGFYSNRKTN